MHDDEYILQQVGNPLFGNTERARTAPEAVHMGFVDLVKRKLAGRAGLARAEIGSTGGRGKEHPA